MRRHIRHLAATALLAVVLVACGTNPDTPVSSPVDEAPPAGDDPAGGTYEALPPERAVHQEAIDLRARGFESALHDETNDSFHILLWIGREPCYALGRVDVEETATDVTITVYEGHLPTDTEVACPDDAHHVSVPINLSQPFADRELRDGATGERVVVNVIRAAEAPMS